ncbi:hypothetical protein [Flavisolibacter nicotianae]|uniref:hypothetical protein n=1 Tax=Flavisolibacter nicotianae TaxID=2364882 RepID=UPI0013C4A6B6|nr:hypothetical protein [Flavisolibacter nicotianae]
MNSLSPQKTTVFLLAIVSLVFFSSCLTSKKMDRFVAEQYNNQLPKEDKKKKADFTVTSAIASPASALSTTKQKTSKVLPLVVYWQYDYRHTCSLNPTIAVTQFSNAVNTLATKGLSQKLNGQHLDLTVEEAPRAFALVDKAHMIWLIYAISWDKIYMEPDFKDLVVSYKVTGAGNAVKAGKITVKNPSQNKGIRFFQSWKSATSEYLADYNATMTAMTKSFVNQLIEEM